MNTLLKNTPVSSVGVDHSRVINVNSNTMITQAFKILYEAKIHSVPVKDISKNTYVSFLDLPDVVGHLFSSFDDKEIEHVKIPHITEWKVIAISKFNSNNI